MIVKEKVHREPLLQMKVLMVWEMWTQIFLKEKVHREPLLQIKVLIVWEMWTQVFLTITPDQKFWRKVTAKEVQQTH